ncbi:condensation domain-containing protein [Phytohabitans rumicis]|uniref:Condensation domain-containing protein n=1 Tax=Phytohabitans rumicis TaxID=1076125 RepID=A0A6V8L1H5_9ACTN|nr:condensation domain-containing protein [Phytohabitans rumicis]GFJ87956.1 hypothetical protein Prum_015980 [Phytohabitans rumicis]
MTHVTVPFEGDGGGVAALAWGQREIWSAMVRQNWWLPIGYALPLPPGTTVDDAVDDIRFCVSRYPTMRTRLRHDPDGHTRQVVAAAGELSVEIVDAADGADPDAAAEQVRQRYWAGDHDFVADWPVKAAIVRHRGAATHLVLVLCHLVIDAMGGLVMLDELAARRAGKDLPPIGTPPLEQVRWQQSPAGQRQTAAALRHWEGLLRTVTPERFAGSTDHQRPRHWEGYFRSPAAHLALQVIAERTKVDASPLLLALFAVSLARLTGINPVVVQVVVGNRFRPGLAESVSPVNQSSLCAIDVADSTVDDAVRLAARRVLATYKNAYYDPSQVDDLVARVGRERGADLDIACYFNDRRLEVRDRAAGPLPTTDQIRAALPHSTFAWGRRQEDPWERLFVHIEDVPDTMALTINGDTHFVSPAHLEACLRGMEQVAVEAALDPAATTRVRRTT